MGSKWVLLSDEDRKEILASCKSLSLLKKIGKAGSKIKVRSAKAKGMLFQKYICGKLSETLNIPWGNEDDSLIASRPSGQHGEDIILRGEAKNRLPFSFEIKNTENLSIVSTIEQAEGNSGGKDWVIVHRKKAMKYDIVIIKLDTFLMLLKRGGF